MEQEPILQTLQRIPWFLELKPSQIETLATIACLSQLDEGKVLFREGDSEDCLFLLLEGQLEVETHVPGIGAVQLYTGEPLDIIGWSVLTPVIRQRTTTVRALTASRLICFNSTILRQMCDEDHDLGYVIMRRIANVVASRMLSTRLRLFEQIHPSSQPAAAGFATRGSSQT